MVGAFVMTQADIMGDRDKVDSVGLGSYNTDSHHVQRVALPDGSALNEGDFQVRVRPYAIPCRSLDSPGRAECGQSARAGLHVGVARGLRHGTDGAGVHDPRPGVRGRREHWPFDGKVPVQGIRSTASLKKLADRASRCSIPSRSREWRSLELTASTRPKHGRRGGRRPGGGEGRRLASFEQRSARYVGEGYLHDGGKADGMARIRYTPKLAKSGRYEVRLYSTPNPEPCDECPGRGIHALGDERTIRVDQRRATGDGGADPPGTFSPSPRGIKAGSRSATTGPTAT